MNFEFLGKRIREERLKLNLTQEKLSESVDISNSYMGQIERGERNVTLDTLIRIANRLGVTIDYLLKESININDKYVNQLMQLMDDKTDNQKQMALDVIKIMFSHLEDK